MIDLKDTINNEQLLDICLDLVACEEYQDEFFAGPAGRVITARAVDNIIKNNSEEFTEEELNKEINEMVAGKILERLTKKGLVQVDFSGEETLFGISEEGLNYLNKRSGK